LIFAEQEWWYWETGDIDWDMCCAYYPQVEWVQSQVACSVSSDPRWINAGMET
jgi:hypothetical protein